MKESIILLRKPRFQMYGNYANLELRLNKLQQISASAVCSAARLFPLEIISQQI